VKSTREFLAELSTQNVKLWREGDQLRCKAPKGLLTPALVEQLQTRKAEIFVFLQQAQVVQQTQPETVPPAILPGPQQGTMPLSFAQQRLWFLHQIQPDSPAYNLHGAFQITGALDVAALTQSLTEIVRRQAVLRTTFLRAEPLQVIAPAEPMALPLIDLGAWPAHKRAAEAQRLAEAEARQPFDLTRGPLLRVSLLKLAAEEHMALITMHHIVSDGWSINLLVKELSALYQAYSAGQPSPLAELPIQYTDYVHWQRAWLQGDVRETQLAYWKKQLAGKPAQLEMPTDRPRPDRQTFRGASQSFTLPATLSAALRTVSRREGVTTFMIFLATSQALLYRYTGQDDISVGTPIANRNRVESEGLIGFFVNMLVMRTQFDGSLSLHELLQRVRQTALAAYAHQDLPFEMLVDALEPTRNLDRNPLFQVALAVHATVGQTTTFAGLMLKPLEIESHAAIFDLLFYVEDDGHHFSGRLQYSTDLFNASTISRLFGHWQGCLEALVDDPTQAIAQLPLLTAVEKQQLVTWNQTQAPYPNTAAVHQLFEAQVARTPDAVAVIEDLQFLIDAPKGHPRSEGTDDDDSTVQGVREEATAFVHHSLVNRKSKIVNQLTYRQLNERANQLAHALQRRGVGPETVVGICLERSPQLLIALYAVLKAGGAYLPLDPTYPAERLAFMLADANVHVLLTQEPLLATLPATTAQVICLDRDWAQLADNQSTNPSNGVQAEQLAYVIYTSGSTGKPKGVMIEHRNLVNYVWWAKQSYLQDEALDFALYSSFAFDLTVTSLFVPLLAGGRIVIYPERAAGYPTILDVVQADLVDVIKLTPAHLTLVQDLIGATTKLRKLIVGGEDFKTTLAQKIIAQRRTIEIYNEYGPTEATVGCMLHRFEPTNDHAASVPIGKPAANQQIYLLDAHLNPTPIGVIGEIYIGGAGIARGYLNRPGLTSERFVPDCTRSGTKLYRTGDLARWHASGQLEFLGRRDQQIKWHGFRIELGEIEAELQSHPAIQACLVDLQSVPIQPGAPVAPAETIQHCVRCGLPSNHPEAQLNAAGVCRVCLTYEEYKDKAAQYFKSMDEFYTLVATMKATRSGDYDCLLLLSGGKDSTYVLYQLVKVMGLKVLTFTLDNGFIAEGAKANIRRVVNDLGVDHIFGTTPAMNTIFADSLMRYSNVCNGCFKTIYTLSMNIARQKGIQTIITGLSRGQIFETRLQDLFRTQLVAVEQMDEIVLEARKTYHRMDDAVAQCLDVEFLQQDATFETLQIVDFYRYCNVELDEMLAFLAQHAPWIRPADTGRSTNCLINEAGIYVHKKERGYHNYALPYSWDVILGHKTRQAALAELDDEINEANVQRILQEVGYDEQAKQCHSNEKRLVAYYVATQAIEASALRAHLAQRLPVYMNPSAFVSLHEFPLTPNGKLDRQALPTPDQLPSPAPPPRLLPRTPTEETVAQIWREVLGVAQISIDASFFALGGHSMLTVQLMHRLSEQFAVPLSVQHLFEHPTVAGLAQVIDTARPASTAQAVTQGTSPLPLPACLAPLRTTGNQPPFFCVHPVAGVVFPYYELAYQLGTDQPFYGLQSPSLMGENPPLTSIEAMAAVYLQALQRVQPDGPYFLGGWSFGAIVAYEMAQQLQKAGKSVALLAIIDNPPPLAKRWAQVWGGVHFFGTTIVPALGAYLAEYWAMRRKQPTARQLPTLQRLVRTILANARASQHYVLQSYPGRITLLRSDQDFTKLTQAADLGWHEFAQGGVDIVRVPGDHMNLLRQPHVQILAERLKVCLAAAKGKG